MAEINLGYYKIEYHTFYKAVKTEELMDKKLLGYTILGALFTFLTGTLLHFTYEWSGNNFWVGLFSPVNESTWEHMKLLFFPMLFYSIISCFLFHLPSTKSMPEKAETFFAHLKGRYPCICLGNALGILLGTFSIPVLFYTYSGILGTHCLGLDIAVFLFSVALGFFFVFYAAQKCAGKRIAGLIYTGLAILLFCFIFFTVSPPNLGLFSPTA